MGTGRDGEGRGTCKGAIGRQIVGQTDRQTDRRTREQTISCQYYQLETITAAGRTRPRRLGRFGADFGCRPAPPLTRRRHPSVQLHFAQSYRVSPYRKSSIFGSCETAHLENGVLKRYGIQSALFNSKLPPQNVPRS